MIKFVQKIPKISWKHTDQEKKFKLDFLDFFSMNIQQKKRYQIVHFTVKNKFKKLVSKLNSLNNMKDFKIFLKIFWDNV
jgi:hypothetical protein